MTLDEAKAELAKCYRDVLADHAFGDAEVYWHYKSNDFQIASGYFGNSGDSVTIAGVTFKGADANSLRYLGESRRYDRNDEGE